jgi:hypothetical protein
LAGAVALVEVAVTGLSVCTTANERVYIEFLTYALKADRLVVTQYTVG